MSRFNLVDHLLKEWDKTPPADKLSILRVGQTMLRNLARGLECPKCHGSGTQDCDDPQCHDSTWDHDCNAGRCDACHGVGHRGHEAKSQKGGAA